MAPKVIKIKSSAMIKKSSNYRGILNNTNYQSGTSFREEILSKLSQNLICRSCAALAWLESFEADLQKVRLDLQAVERAIKKRNRSSKGMAQLKLKPFVHSK
nr:uncharacterized protein LOC113699551 [Coffea arabica]XP_027078182.1 uncharacterized protein LOC113701632 [Coffea arabica]